MPVEPRPTAHPHHTHAVDLLRLLSLLSCAMMTGVSSVKITSGAITSFLSCSAIGLSSSLVGFGLSGP